MQFPYMETLGPRNPVSSCTTDPWCHDGHFCIIKSIGMLECVYLYLLSCVRKLRKMLLCKNITKVYKSAGKTTFTPPLGVWKNTTWQTLAARPKPPGGFHVRRTPCNGGRSWVSLEPPGGKGGVLTGVTNTRILRGIQPANIKINPMQVNIQGSRMGMVMFTMP